MSARNGSGLIWGMTLRERLVLVLVGTLIVVAKFYLRIPIRVPGHSGLFWMALLIVGVGVVRRPGSGTVIGMVSGLLATMFLPGSQGLLVGIKYLVPGIMVDVLTPALGGRLDRVPVAVVVATVANVSKLITSYIIGLLLGVPGGYLAVGLGVAATTHVVFGALGGLIGAVVLGRLARAGIPQPRQGVPVSQGQT